MYCCEENLLRGWSRRYCRKSYCVEFSCFPTDFLDKTVETVESGRPAE